MSDIDPTQRGFVSYIDKSREFYLAKGYGNPYRWASNPDAPFTPLAKPLAESRVALVTTAARICRAGGSAAGMPRLPGLPPRRSTPVTCRGTKRPPIPMMSKLSCLFAA